MFQNLASKPPKRRGSPQKGAAREEVVFFTNDPNDPQNRASRGSRALSADDRAEELKMAKKMSETDFEAWKAERNARKDSEAAERELAEAAADKAALRETALESAESRAEMLMARRRSKIAGQDREAEEINRKLEREDERERAKVAEAAIKQEQREYRKNRIAVLEAEQREREEKRVEDKARAQKMALIGAVRAQQGAEFEAEMRALAIQVMTGNMTHIEVGAKSFVVPNKTALSVRPSKDRTWTLAEAETEGVPFDKEHLGKWADIDLSPKKPPTKPSTEGVPSHNSPPPKSGEWKPTAKKDEKKEKEEKEQTAIDNVFNEIEDSKLHVDSTRIQKKESKRGSKKKKGR